MTGPEPRLHLPFARWPIADQLLWERSMSTDDPFSSGGGARLSKATRHDYLFGWRRILGFLAKHEPEALELAPEERLTPERIRSFAAHLAETNTPRSVASVVHAVYLAARMMMPECDWTWLKGMKARLQAGVPVSSAAGPVITSVQLLDMGQQLMDENRGKDAELITLVNDTCYRNGLMLAICAFVPLRRRNLAAIEIGRHLVRESDRWFVVVPQEETKTGTPIEFPIPELLDSYLGYYLDVVRPRLLRDSICTALWVSANGGALVYGVIGHVFTRLSRRFGFRIAPHDIRDAAATTWAIAAPDKIGIARDLLAHTDLRTTTRHYNRARGIEASRAYRQVIAEIRGKQNRRSKSTNSRSEGRRMSGFGRKPEEIS